jgi:hypothetical protein
MPAKEPTVPAVMIFMKVRRSVFDIKYDQITNHRPSCYSCGRSTIRPAEPAATLR